MHWWKTNLVSTVVRSYSIFLLCWWTSSNLNRFSDPWSSNLADSTVFCFRTIAVWYPASSTTFAWSFSFPSLVFISVWQGVARDSLNCHPGPLCPTLIHPVGGPSLKQPYSRFKGDSPAGCVACRRLLPRLRRRTLMHVFVLKVDQEHHSLQVFRWLRQCRSVPGLQFNES
jgi:hypothetical protein